MYLSKPALASHWYLMFCIKLPTNKLIPIGNMKKRNTEAMDKFYSILPKTILMDLKLFYKIAAILKDFNYCSV
jgi:hypothetical protein